MGTQVELTTASLKLLNELFDDAENWGGIPLFGGNVGTQKEDKGNLTDLKKKGYVTTDEEDGNSWVYFTDKARGLLES
jgi:hypothetical protein